MLHYCSLAHCQIFQQFNIGSTLSFNLFTKFPIAVAEHFCHCMSIICVSYSHMHFHILAILALFKMRQTNALELFSKLKSLRYYVMTQWKNDVWMFGGFNVLLLTNQIFGWLRMENPINSPIQNWAVCICMKCPCAILCSMTIGHNMS